MARYLVRCRMVTIPDPAPPGTDHEPGSRGPDFDTAANARWDYAQVPFPVIAMRAIEARGGAPPQIDTTVEGFYYVQCEATEMEAYSRTRRARAILPVDGAPGCVHGRHSLSASEILAWQRKLLDTAVAML